MAVSDRPPHADQSLPELLKQLSADTTRLVHQELELAKAELAQKGRQAGAGAGLFGAAGAIGLLGAAALTTCFILALHAVMPPGWPRCSWPSCTGPSPWWWPSRARPS